MARSTTIICDRTGKRAPAVGYDNDDSDHVSPPGWAAVTITIAKVNPEHAEVTAAARDYDKLLGERIAAQLPVLRAEHEKQAPWNDDAEAHYVAFLTTQAEAEIGERPDPDDVAKIVIDTLSYDLAPEAVDGLTRYLTAGSGE